MTDRHTSTAPLLDEVRIKVPAKINLALCVGPLGDDGYHPLGTVFHAVSLFDHVIARRSARPGVSIEVKCLTEGVPTDGTNLAVRAAELLLDRYEVDAPGVALEVRKTIPVAGGMAGGSADAAAALMACAMLWDLDTTPTDLHELAAELGSDVPFALHGGNALATGRGTDVVPLLSRGTYHWVLALAPFGLSTPQVFGHFDTLGTSHDTAVPDDLLNALAVGDVDKVARSLRNDLQAAAVDLRPELGEILDLGVASGALGGVLSGSGPTCAFLVRSESQGLDVAAALSKHPAVRTAKLVEGPVPGARLVS